MPKLFFLNRWAKTRDRLFYPDRQGLYKVKARLLEEAYRAGYIRLPPSVTITSARTLRPSGLLKSWEISLRKVARGPIWSMPWPPSFSGKP